ncbi:caspase family protein [Phanerochaete sordida]|uniref:Caspase family protein n=1 Tax=Phanerochaete sordida TaxID=48140 RepID=A0A9P3G0J2_9APHY|nr:caspase family protein [Phanerochaete sordida]
MPHAGSHLRVVLPARHRTRKAMLVGVRYNELDRQQPLMKYMLKSTYADVEHLEELLTDTMKFAPEDIAVFRDDIPTGASSYPNRENLLRGMRELVSDVKPGDHLVFHFSGHGSQKPDQDGDEDDGLDEAVWPADVKPGVGAYDAENVILDDEIKEILVNKIPSGAHLIIILDCCHSGSGADLKHCHKDHWEAQVHDEILHPLQASKVSVQKIGLKGLVTEKPNRDTTSPMTSFSPRNIPEISVLSPLTPPTADASCPSPSSTSSTPASSLFDWPTSTPSTASSFSSFDEQPLQPVNCLPKQPVVISWAACQDPDTTLSLANSGGYFVKAFVEAFREVEDATHETLLHLIKEKMRASLDQFVEGVVQRACPSTTHHPSPPQNFIGGHTSRHQHNPREIKVEKAIWESLEKGKQAHPEPMLATLHDYHGVLRTPVASVFGIAVSVTSEPETKEADQTFEAATDVTVQA